MHIARKFERLLETYRHADGRRWTGQEIDEATGGIVTRSYVTNLRKGRIENPGFSKMEAIAEAMGFPPALWFGRGEEERIPEAALVAALEDGTIRAILEEALSLGRKDRELLLRMARQVSPSSEEG